MQYEIKGTLMPNLEVKLAYGESIYTESGGMAWMSEGIDMQTSGRGGLGGMLGRALAGESLFLTTYTCQAQGGLIVFTPDMPGTVMAMELGPGQSIIAQKDAFMCAQESVQLEMHFRKKLGTGIFGGEGFILQKVTGPGIVFFEIAGEVREYDLGPGSTMKVDTGHIAMYEPTVNYDIQMVKGVTNMLFGGEGLFLAHLRGPGHVWLQSLPFSRMAGRMLAAVPGRGIGNTKGEGSVLGGLGNLLDGDGF